ncbi:hypothetical protein ACOSP7_001609 [Xanthoceras sorbifolium]
MCPSEKQISSNSDEKPPAEEPLVNETSLSGVQITTSSADVTLSPISILDSVDKISHSRQSRPNGDSILGRTAAAAGTNALGELRPPRTARGCTDWYDMCTESLGFESLAEKMDICNLPAEVAESPSRTSIFKRSRTTRTCGLMREKKDSKGFPPILSTLDWSGRSRYSYEGVRTDDGRLRIAMVERNTPEIIRTSGEEGVVVMKMLTSRDQEDDEKNSVEKSKNDEQEQEQEQQEVAPARTSSRSRES